MIASLIDIALQPGMWAVFGLALVAGFARGLAGFGVGLIMMPVGAAVLGPAVMVPLMALIDIPTSVWLARGVWRDFDRREVGLMLGSAYVGIPAGIALLVLVDAEIIKTAAGLIVLASALALVTGFKLSGAPSVPRTLATGFSSGILEGSVGLPGPPVILVWLATQVPGLRLRANTIVYFLGLMAFVIPSFWVAGLLTVHVWQITAVVMPVFFAGVALGKASVGFVPDALFRKIVLGLVIAGAVSSLLA